jgi:hypothetical protein
VQASRVQPSEGAEVWAHADQLLGADVQWEATGDGELPYAFDGWTVRVNDFPAEPLYTLLCEGFALDLEDWPASWVRPPGTGRPARA